MLIVIKANFLHLLHCSFFFISCHKKIRISKISTDSQNLRYNFYVNQYWKKMGSLLCLTTAGLSLIQKRIFHYFFVKSSKFLTTNQLVKLNESWKFLYQFEVLEYIPLIWYLICWSPISRLEMEFIYVISTNLVDIEFGKYLG